MIVEDVIKRVEKVSQSATDDETAHGLEDDLYADVLRAIADDYKLSRPKCAELAREALKTKSIPFSRWHA